MTDEELDADYYMNEQEWCALMTRVLNNASTLACNFLAEDYLQYLNKDPEHQQCKTLKLIKETFDLDIIHREAASQLGMTEKVAELDAWISKKKPRGLYAD